MHIARAFLVVLALVLAGCGGGDAEPESAGETTVPLETATTEAPTGAA